MCSVPGVWHPQVLNCEQLEKREREREREREFELRVVAGPGFTQLVNMLQPA